VVLLPLVLACQAIFVAGVVCIVSPLALVVRDVAEIVRFATMMLLVISPIAYLPSGTDGAINLLVSLNPLSHFIMAYQKILVFSEAPSLGALAAMIAISLSVYAAGFVFLHRVKPALGEYAT
jgi:ABC-type polysaccharide/polyol phosphate export permease